MLLPLPPLGVLFLLPEGNAPHVLFEPIAVFVYATVGVAWVSALVLEQAERLRGGGFAAMTGALAVLAGAVMIIIVLETQCASPSC